jgi:outer membrane protein OmpA-like peptidoglycan-associated protein
MSDPKDIQPDDFSKTVPSIRSSPPKNDVTDWGKTVYGKQPSAFSEQPDPGQADFGVTQQNIKIPREVYEPDSPKDYEPVAGATMPYFRLPENERAKYQNAQAEIQPNIEQKEEKKIGGFPAWFWVSAGLMLMFLFSVLVLFGVYFVFNRNTGFNVSVKGAPLGSDIFVGDVRWNVTSADGSYSLKGLVAGERTIKVKNPKYLCEDMKVIGKDGVDPEPLVARCKDIQVQKPMDECLNIKSGEYAKAERCANIALDNLPDPFQAEDLAKALNIFIINFASGKFDIPQANMTFVTRAATYIQKLPPNILLEVGGHTDNVGKIAKNQPLSENRSNAVKNALVKLGVKSEMLQTKGYGDTMPKTSNDMPDGRFLNRRIEYKVLSK